jgi:hypothetical protein
VPPHTPPWMPLIVRLNLSYYHFYIPFLKKKKEKKPSASWCLGSYSYHFYFYFIGENMVTWPPFAIMEARKQLL